MCSGGGVNANGCGRPFDAPNKGKLLCCLYMESLMDDAVHVNSSFSQEVYIVISNPSVIYEHEHCSRFG